MQGVQKMALAMLQKQQRARRKNQMHKFLLNVPLRLAPLETDETLLSDTQAMLNPVASQANLELPHCNFATSCI